MLSKRLLLLLFPPLALVSPLLEAFGTLSIPLFTVPSLALVGSVAAFGVALGATAAVLWPHERSHWVRHHAYVAALVAISLVILDVAVGGHRVLSAVAATRIGRLGALIGLGSFLFAAFWPVRRRAAPVLFVASAAFFVSTVVLNPRILALRIEAAPSPAPPPAATDLPPFVYIVLDEAMGVHGLELAPGGQTFAHELRNLFESHGFRVYGAAFSRHFASSRSIPNALNFDFRDDSWGQTLRYNQDGKVRSVLFERLARDGYKVVSYGTEHIDFCFPVAARCEVLPSFNPASPYLEQLRVQDLYHVMWRTFAESYLIFRYIAVVFSVTDWPRSTFAGFDARAFPRWFERFESDIATNPRGRAYYAHLVMPHAPFVFDGACRKTGESREAYYLRELRELTPDLLDDVRAEGYRHYLGQYRCLAGKLKGLLARIQSLPQFSDATIVVHGDHGSRISAGQYAESLSDRDMIDNYSAFFAIRSPNIDPGFDPRKTSIQRLTAEYFSRRGRALGADNLTIAIDSREASKVVVRPMPDIDTVLDSQ